MEGYIYKLTSPNTDLYYIGSTIQTLQNRLYYHHKNKNASNITSKKILEAGDAKIELIETFIFEDEKDLRKREKEIICKNKEKCVNERSIYKDKKECNKAWREKNREKIR